MYSEALIYLDANKIKLFVFVLLKTYCFIYGLLISLLMILEPSNQFKVHPYQFY